MNKIAIIGNSPLTETSPKQGGAIDSYDRILRMNGAGSKSIIEKYSDYLGHKMTDYAWNCYAGHEVFKEMLDVKCYITVSKLPNSFLYLPDDFEQRISTKFKNIKYIIRFDEKLWQRIYQESGLKSRPTTGVLMIYYFIFQGITPVLFNYNMDNKLKHYYDNAVISSDSPHDVGAEVILLEKLRDSEMIIYG